ncbi:hypothetical protein [Sediminicoccus rosea]|uniref:Uncharacterized protein n=1 Tax=Sediminicoccus rosea TaxID=1225128 RepID=A0ABZ0PMI9_9PROT|nr:hypothetical protein [Sediminicoccus rosea]WPB86926.1 hypothetical protein R9Z33_08620 [Sediminicoccus rosea]
MTPASLRAVLAALWRVAWQGSMLIGASAGAVAAVLYIADFAFPSPGEGGTAPADFNVVIGLILTAVTVILGALALVLAVAAVVGYAQIKAAVERTTAEEAREMTKAVTPDGARPVAEAIARETAAAVASRVAGNVAEVIAARTFAAASERGVEPSSDGDDLKSAAVGGEGDAKPSSD